MTIYDEIAGQRKAQDEQWGGPEHDDSHTRGEWISYILRQLWKAENLPRSDTAGFRERLVKIAALAVAAIEGCDREEARK